MKSGKRTVELAAEPPPSRIRREPPPAAKQPLPGFLGKIDWNSREMEIVLAIGGILFFALAIDIITVAISVFYK